MLRLTFGLFLMQVREPAWVPQTSLMVQDPTFLDRWQSLVGSALGTLGAFAIAILAYALTRFSERQEAAFTVYFELQMYQTAVSAFLDRVDEPPLPAEVSNSIGPNVFEYVKAVEQLRGARPAVSPRLDSAMAKLYSMDLVLAAHLEGFRATALAAERVFMLLEDAEKRQLAGQHPGYDKDELFSVVRSAGGMAKGAASEAHEANKLIGAMYVNRGAWFERLKRRARRHKLPNELLESLLEKRSSSSVDHG